ncbi:MAG: hypothetical protein J5J06_13545 [Phycisphaerae bacterium]|nr:hypothetical protein [Phycisphaerae bacterium]
MLIDASNRLAAATLHLRGLAPKRFEIDLTGGATVPITMICPRLRCRAMLRVPDSVRGKRVRCSECGVSFFVPELTVGRAAPRKKEAAPAGNADTNVPAENPS